MRRWQFAALCVVAAAVQAAGQLGFGEDAGTNAPGSEDRDMDGLVMGMGWGLFLVLLLALLTIMGTLVASAASKAGAAVGVAGGAVTLAVLIFLLECPTRSEHNAAANRDVRSDPTAQFRDAVLGLAIATALVGLGANVSFAMSLRMPFVPRPKRGLQTHRQYKSGVQASLR
eukprot:TRINITY_DN4097_c0_g3_i1.p3 TRINITY_DN4097_c0_g3~~TRINITY_DN4097_c0_g3_i1.p3  ORF type:complete len:172 (+),score=33.07 TRINITY_DN4097_c0_g3_i1:85-600(+)